MSLHRDLLAQARHLMAREPRRPRQASLRRAVSAAYYALFHLLISEASRMLVTDAPLRLFVSRTFVHAEMSKSSRSFAGGTLPQRFDEVVRGEVIPPQLREVGKAFVELQQARHDADYNLARRFTRNETRLLVDQADRAFTDWQSIRNHRLSRLYLACLLLWERWEKLK